MPHHWQAWDALAKELNFHFTLPKLLSLAGKPTPEILQILCTEQNITDLDIPAAVARKTAIFVDLEQQHETKLVEVVMEIARAAKARGLPCAVATGGNRKQVAASMKAAGVETYFDAVVTCDTFLKAAAAIGVDPADCVGYEDAPLGMEAIKRAGFMLAVDVTKLPGWVPKLAVGTGKETPAGS
ncbi:hypothetical protein N2152v2_011238 [Parachlorella kessleri]